MRLSELLLHERLSSFVHVNDKASLEVISNLVQRKFGLKNPSYMGICLYSQFIFTLASVTGIPENVIQDHYDISDMAEDGHTPAELIKHINSTVIEHNGAKYRLKVDLEEYSGIDQVLTTVRKGQPVVAIIRGHGDFYRNISHAEHDVGKSSSKIKLNGREPGEVVATPAELDTDNAGRNDYHALLVIGYDSGSDLVIIREIRDTYAYKGYIRVNRKIFLDNQKSFKYIGFVVDSMKKI